VYIQSGIHPPDRKPAILVARSLQSLLFFYEVESGARILQDGVEDVYMFLDDYDVASGSGSGRDDASGSGGENNANGNGGSGGGTGLRPSPIERTELPTGIMTFLTKCYSPLCDGTMGCYANDCPRRVSVFIYLFIALAEINKILIFIGINTVAEDHRDATWHGERGLAKDSSARSVGFAFAE